MTKEFFEQEKCATSDTFDIMDIDGEIDRDSTDADSTDNEEKEESDEKDTDERNMYSDEEDVSVKAYLVLHAIEDPFAKDDEIPEIVKVSRYYYHAKKEYFADNIENKPAITSTRSGKLNCSSVVLSLHILNAFAAIN